MTANIVVAMLRPSNAMVLMYLGFLSVQSYTVVKGHTYACTLFEELVLEEIQVCLISSYKIVTMAEMLKSLSCRHLHMGIDFYNQSAHLDEKS